MTWTGPALVASVVVGQTVTPTGDVAAAITLVTQIGLSAVFLWQWRDERRERRDVQATMLAFVEKFGPALESSTTTLERVQAGMAAQVERVSTVPERRDFDTSLRRLELAADELGLMMRRARRSEEENA